MAHQTVRHPDATMTRFLSVLILVVIPAAAIEVGQADVAELEAIVNGVKLDQAAPGRADEGHLAVAPDAPLGQTFVTGPDVVELVRVALWQAFWHDTWQPDERLVLTLWDSPAKQVRLGRDALGYDRRMWESAVPFFYLEARLEPGRSYYLALTVEIEPLRPAEIPQDWVLSGRRPPAAGGDGTIGGVAVARGHYPGGDLHVGGQPRAEQDLWFETHVRTRYDRDALFAEAFGRFDLGRPELAAVAAAVGARDWRAALQALIEHFEGRADLLPPEQTQVAYDPAFDTKLADLAAAHLVLLDDGTTVDLGPRWNHFTLWPERGGVGLTRTGLRGVLAAGYRRTGNEKYARAMNAMLWHFYRDHPSPVRAGVFGPEGEIPAAMPAGIAGGSVWSGLSIGARLAHGFYYYAPFVRSPFFTPAVRAAWILNMPEMAEVLERQKGGGNWETQMAMGLFEVGENYPEFAGARRYIEQGFATLVDNALSTVRPDGVLQEPAIGYHQMVMRRYARLMRLAGQYRLVVPPEMARLTERMYEYVMYAVLPDGTLPIWGDANSPMRPQDLEPDAAQFGRDDFLYVGTRGARGTPPADLSRGFPDGGYYFMRSGWHADAHYLGVHAGPNGSHGHHDALGVVVAAHGVPRLIDPGIYIYGTPEARELTRTRSHNTVTVEDADAIGGAADLWRTGPEFDLLAAHTTGLRGLDGVTCHRRIVFVKPRGERPAFWVLFDDVRAASDAPATEREVAVRYRFAHGSRVETSPGGARTVEPRGNLTVRVLEPEAASELGEGLAAIDGGGLARVPLLTARRRGALPIALTTVLVPHAEAPTAVDAELLPVDAAGPGARAVRVGQTVVAVNALPAAETPMSVTVGDRPSRGTRGAAAVWDE